MKIVIIGAGTVGYALAELLCAEQHDVTAIDTDALLIESLTTKFDCFGVAGNGVSYDIQAEADVSRADLVIAVTNSDEQNLLACVTAKALGAAHTVARVRNPEYLDQTEFFTHALGVDLIVNPEMELAHEIANVIHYPAAVKLEPFTNGRVHLVAIRIQDNMPIVGCALRDLPAAIRNTFLVCAVERDTEVMIPNGDFVPENGDLIYVTAPQTHMASLFRSLNMEHSKIKNVMIVGGGEAGIYLAQLLTKRNIFVKIIEINPEVCERLSEMVPKATIICGDGSDSTLLEEEGVARADALVALTDCDEENIILSMYARTKEVGKIITQVTKSPLESMLPAFGFTELTLAPQTVIANTILRYVRGIEQASGTAIQTLYRLVQNRVEALEFVIPADDEHLNIPLRDLTLESNLLLGCIVRQKNVIYPNGETTLTTGDHVIVVTTRTDLREFSDIFA